MNNSARRAHKRAWQSYWRNCPCRSFLVNVELAALAFWGPGKHLCRLRDVQLGTTRNGARDGRQYILAGAPWGVSLEVVRRFVRLHC
mgnify:CR=1 FL=1